MRNLPSLPVTLMLLPVMAVMLVLGVRAASATDCTNETWQGNRYSVCKVDAAHEDLRLFLYGSDGKPYGDFDKLNAMLADQGKMLTFAMNAGMYHEDRSPVGHYVENGKQLMRIIPNAGPGNFGMLPNGVLCIGHHRARVEETLKFRDDDPGCTYATQSGPMLVIDGQIHPKFLPDSTSRYIRNGVGTSADGKTAWFVISRNAVSLWDFADFFHEGLGLNEALYLDGNVSRLYTPQLERDDWGREMGPIVGVVVPVPEDQQH